MAAATQAAPPVPAASAASGTVPAAASPGIFAGEGKIESVDADGITISHGPIRALKWPGMTMGFGKPDPKAFPDVKPGDNVQFEFRKGGAMGYELVAVRKTGAAK
jgi:Cu(I)/Ag(I) efflux system membrane fusion protein